MEPSEMPEKGPWSVSWQEAIAKTGAVQPAPAPVEKASKKPWEYSISEAIEAGKALFKDKVAPPPQQALVAPSKPLPKDYTAAIPTEEDMKTAASDLFTPQANKKRDAQESSPGNIAELKAEIAKTKNAKTKKILEDYLKQIGGE